MKTFYVSYNFLFCMIRTTRLRALKLKENLKNVDKAIKETERILDIITKANKKSFINNIKSIKRKYTTRLSIQNKKKLKLIAINNFSCTIKFFYYILIYHIAKLNNESEEFLTEIDSITLDDYLLELESFDFTI